MRQCLEFEGAGESESGTSADDLKINLSVSPKH